MRTHRNAAHALRQGSATLYALLAALLLFGSCAKAVASSSARVISLAPHITELLYAAGAGDQIVATVNSSNYPDEAKGLPHVGDGVSVNLEKLLQFKPDIVYAWQNTLAISKLAPQLKALNIKLVFVAPQNILEIPEHIKRLGHQLGSYEVAAANSKKLEEQLSYLQKNKPKRSGGPVSTFIEIGYRPVYTLGNDPLTNSALELCGGRNAFAESKLVAPAVTAESVMLANPEVIIIASNSNSHLQARTQYWSGLGLVAAQNKHVHAINPDTLLRPGPRIVHATKTLCKIIAGAR